MNQDARRAAERAARQSYGKLVSILMSRSRDISGSEDALADAFASALRHWPERGIPANPDAWLLASARNALMNAKRSRKVHALAAMEISRRYEELSSPDNGPFPDERLKLLFVCAHPAIDPSIRTPLMLQTVLGLDAARIAGAFLVSPTTMSQRLVRAKAKIRETGIAFDVPERETWSERLSEVLDAIYAAFGNAWDTISETEGTSKDLSAEAIFLGRLLVELLPDEPEAKGLLSLMLYCEARRDGRRDEKGQFIPLREQHNTSWNRDMIIDAERLLSLASAQARLGRYQCEAAIQSVHVQAPLTGQTNFEALHLLYRLLASLNPTVGVLIAQASVWLQAGNASAALEALDQIENDSKTTYQPYWVTKFFCLNALGIKDEAGEALETAMRLTEDLAIRQYLSSLRRLP